MLKDIVIKGAKENNLKNVDLTIPKEKLVVFTGVSGSGKSTLAFDTIFAEGQRRYMESLSSYARQFLGQMSKPDVESIDGLSPSISIDQKTTSNNPRSTVGTVTEIYDYLRLFFAHIGTPYCPHCNKPIKTQTIDNIVDRIMEYENGTKIMLMANICNGKKGTFANELKELQKEGYVRVRVDGEIRGLDEDIKLEKNKSHSIYVVVDRLVVADGMEKRLTESVEQTLKLGKGKITVNVGENDILYSTMHSCPECDYSIDEIAPRVFSFNTPYGACDECDGLGFKQIIDEKKLITNEDLTLAEGCIHASGWAYDNMMSSLFYRSVTKHFGESVNTPWRKLSANAKEMLLYGTKGEKIAIEYTSKGILRVGEMKFEGIIPNLMKRYRETTSDFIKNDISKLFTELVCPKCKGKRLNEIALNIFVDGKNIWDVCNMSIKEAKEYFSKLKLTDTQKMIAEPILKEINNRLNFLLNVGLDYLNLWRMSSTLSGGEAQRIRLATQIGSGLTGVIYILDEPSIGLHQRDNEKLIQTLKNLRDLGNTVIVVEHDEDTMRNADFLVDIGPFAGVRGGEVVATGSVEDIEKQPRSLTGKYLSGEYKIEIPKNRRAVKNGYVSITGATHHNLKNINVDIPLGVLTAVTGVSGSGKSSLVNEILFPAVNNYINKTSYPVGAHKSIKGLEKLDKIINIDQSPIGRTPRSNPATYTNVFTDIRNLFASTVDAKERGYTSGRFSFNIAGGRCEHCGGAGINKIEMFFLPDMYVTCEECGGKRYNRETLQVKYKGKSIYDVLEMTIEEANLFFENIPKIHNKLQTLVDVGLGYIKLGQPATQLSGGEAQRVKLATELSRRGTGSSLYILDEPTTGLHSYDVDKLIKILNRLVDGGNTVVVIEHNLDVINCADYIIDLGPEGGDNGGTVVVTGTPEEVKKSGRGYTSKYIK